MICIAALLSWGFIIATVIAVQHGMGLHMDEVMKRGTRNLEHYIKVRNTTTLRAYSTNTMSSSQFGCHPFSTTLV